MSEPRRIRSVPVGFGADGPEWADESIFTDLDGLTRGVGSPWPYPWTVVVEWTIEDGRAVATGMELQAMHGQPVTATAWRSVPVAQVIERARKDTRELHDFLATLHRHNDLPGAGGMEHERASADLAPAPRRRRGRPFAMSDRDYQRVADVYNTAVATGDPHPRKAVAGAFDSPPSDTRPKAWISEARRRGLIPGQLSATQSRMAGQ